MPDTCGAGSVANDLLIELLGDKTFPVPQTDLDGIDYQIPLTPPGSEVKSLTIKDLTERTVDGDGAFDALMQAMTAHITQEYEKDRITGHEYATTYLGITQGVLGASVQFLMGKDQAYWQAKTAELQARMVEVQIIQARVDVAVAKTNLALIQYKALTAETEYATAKIRLAVEDMNLCLAKAQLEDLGVETDTKRYNLDMLMPIQKETAEAQLEGLDIDNNIKTFNLSEMLPKQKELLDEQVEGVGLDNESKEYTNTNILPVQKALVEEQVEVQRAQTADVRTDGAPIRGSLGKQKDLYDQQIKSYKDDSKTKVAKIYSDAWITMRTMDEGYPSPNAFKNENIHSMLSDVATSVQLPTPTNT